MAVCGPKLSLCCVIISAWGIVMLLLLGVFAYIQSPALAEDIPVDEHAGLTWTKVQAGYKQTAYNCWIAAAIYIVTLLFSLQQYHANSRASYQV